MTECANPLHSALKKGDVSQTLFKGSSDKDLIVDLQQMLYELGFQKKLKWDQFQADGAYGKATSAAVLAFAQKNKLESDGTSVSNAVLESMLQHHSFLPSMYILWSIHSSDLRKKKYISKGTKTSIIAIQVLLNELGYGEQLQFEKFGADGLYGGATKSAVIAFAKDNNIESDGDLLSRPLCNLLIKHINAFYGKDWSDLATKNLPNEKSPLVYYDGSRFMGKPCRADVLFVPMLDKINAYAEEAEVFVVVTSSFRTTTNVRGAIVKPATFSNHLVGHGIDMNLKFGNNQYANSKVLRKYPDVPAPVKQFLKSIIDDPDLRWGGKFHAQDPVHIDDGLNRRDRQEWEKRYEIMQKAVQLGE